MKQLLVILVLFICLLGCCTKQPLHVPIAGCKPDTVFVHDTVFVKDIIDHRNLCIEQTQMLRDSLEWAKSRMMNEKSFVQIYRYQRLLGYYNICVNKPSQWVYYRGWSTRVFKGEEDGK